MFFQVLSYHATASNKEVERILVSFLLSKNSRNSLIYSDYDTEREVTGNLSLTINDDDLQKLFSQ